MKVLAIITGIGYGHSIREVAILDYLIKRKAEIAVAGYSNSLDYFKNKFQTIEILGPKFPESSHKMSNFKTFLLNLPLPFYYIKNYLQLKTTLKAFQPDIIITDFEPIALYLDKNIPKVLIFNFDPEIYKEYIKTNPPEKYQYKYINFIYNKAKKTNVPIVISTLLGKKEGDYNYINPILRELPEENKEKLKLRKEPIIISLGGSNFGVNLLHKLIDILPKFKEEFLIFSYKTIGKSHKNMHFLPFKENFLEYMKVSKAVVMMGGHTTIAECLALKKPILTFPTPNLLEQQINAFEIKKHNLGLIGNTEATKKEIENLLKDFINNLHKIESNIKKLNLKANGAEQVYEIINNSLES